MLQNNEFEIAIEIEPTSLTLVLPIANYVDNCIPLNENRIFVYFDGGDYVLYNYADQQQILSGKIASGCKVFKQIWDYTLLYVDEQDLKVKLIDFNTNLISDTFIFDASLDVKANSNPMKKETVAESKYIQYLEFLILVSEGKQNDYLVTLDQKRQYSYEKQVEILIRDIPKQYNNNIQIGEYTKVYYPNITGQSEMYHWNIDKSTLVIFGQDFENGEIEFCLIKPALKEQSIYVVKINEPKSYTLMNVTNWHSEHEIAVWLNNNEGTEVPCIDIIDFRPYFNPQMNSWPENQPEYMAQRRIAALDQDELPSSLIDIVYFQRNQPYVIQQRLVGNEPYLSFIDWRDEQGKLISEKPIGDWNYNTPTNKSYVLYYDEFKTEGQMMEIKVDYIKTKLVHDIRYHVLKMMEEMKVLEVFEAHNINEVFEFFK